MSAQMTFDDLPPSCEACAARADLRGEDARTGVERFACWTHVRSARDVRRFVVIKTAAANAAALRERIEP